MTAHKNSGNRSAPNWQKPFLLYSILLLIVSVYISRGALSVSTILFIGVALVHKNSIHHFRRFVREPILWMLSLLFFVPFVSGLWSTDVEQWSDVVRIKLPLFFLPLAFAGNWNFSERQWRMVAGVFLFCVAAGCMWGLIDYLQNTAQINESYQRAKTILTPLEDDHVRYSWLVSVAVMLSVLLFHRVDEKRSKVVLLSLAVFFVAYLHILSARTGLLSLYLFLLLYAVHFLWKAKNKKWSLAALACIILLPMLAYLILPTFKARLHYQLYDLSFVQKEEYLPGSSDGARVMSLKAGWQVLQQNPLGVGAGDVMAEANNWYAANVPQVLGTDKFYPSSEWLMYGGFAGWPGVILFTSIMLLPFFQRPKKYSLFWIAFHATAAFSFVFDMGLEVQYGVLLYALITCWWWKWLNTESQEQLNTKAVV